MSSLAPLGMAAQAAYAGYPPGVGERAISREPAAVE